MLNQTELETVVTQSLEEMLERYQQLDGLTELMMNKHQQNQTIDEEIGQLNQMRSELMELEENSKPINEAYRSSRRHASQQVQHLTTQTAALIEKVIASIAELESAARVSYERLTPQINQNVKGNQMKQAYGKLRR